MPPKIRKLVVELKSHGFVEIKGGGKGSHRKFEHPMFPRAVTLSGKGETMRGHIRNDRCNVRSGK